ncbi:hypothetical protein [Klebsiella pneumoniae]|uniref:hypothetical protein n=1 Tax=Klebsiella pneumoniae TaxID=573 RepID=UPI00117AD24E|nr:hypothetical protein [Klebsiella pneumoniae]
MSITLAFKEATRLIHSNIEMASQLQSLVHQFNLQSKSALLPTKKCSDLKEEKHYVIHSMKKMETSVGDAVLATLGEAPFKEGDGPKFQVFLPKRFLQVLQNEDLDSIKPGMMFLVAHGDTGNNSTELSLHLSNTPL